MSDPSASPDERQPASGLKRRTIIASAAWTIPVVSLAVASPAMAASDTKNPSVRFGRTSYDADPCQPLTGMTVQAFDDTNVPAKAGSVVTVNLPEGYTFSDGSNSKSLTTDANGSANVPAITVTAPDGQDTFTAAYDSAAGTTDVNVDSSVRGIWGRMDANGNFGAFPAVPAASTPYGFNYFVGPGGALWYNNSRVDGAGSVTGGSAWQTPTAPASNRFAVKNANDVWFQVNGGTRGSNLSVPASFVSKGNGYFLNPNNSNPDLVYTTTDGGSRTEFSVDGSPNKVSAYDIPGTGNVVTFYAQRTLADGSKVSGWWRVVNGDFANIEQLPDVPANAKNLGYDFFQSGTTLYYKNRSGIVNAPTSTQYPGIATFIGTSDGSRMNIRNPSGTWYSTSAGQMLNKDWGSAYPDVPATAKPLGYNFFLDRQGRLWSGNTVVRTGVARAAVGFSGVNSDNLVNIKIRDCA